MNKFTRILAIVMAVFSLASCGAKLSIDGEWSVVSVEGQTVEASEKAPYLVFNESEGTVHGFLGVNLLNGTYSLKGDKLSLEHLGTTMMSGLPQDMDVEAKLLNAINSAAVARMEEGKLLIYDAEGKELLTLARS